MKRGELYTVRERGSVASKSRPCVIVQTDLSLPAPHHVTICPLTSVLRGLPLIRIPVAPDGINGLQKVSEVEVDWIDTVEVDKLGALIGRLDPAVMILVDDALRRWLAL